MKRGTIKTQLGVFTPTGEPQFRGRGARTFSANRRLWEGPAADSARLFIGMNVGGEPVWKLKDVMNVVRAERMAQTGSPDSSFIVQKGIFKHESGEIVEEDSVQVLIYNLDESVSYDRFKQDMLDLATRLAEVLQQESIIVEMRSKCVSPETIGVGPDKQLSQPELRPNSRSGRVSNMDEPTKSGRHPTYPHLVMFEIEPHYGSYILTAAGHRGSALISEEDARDMFGKDFEDGFGYLVDDYLELLEDEA